MKIYLNNVDKLKLFCEMAVLFKGDVTLKSGRYNINGKSILGIFSLDLTKPIEIELECVNEIEKEEFIKDLKSMKFILEE